MRWWEYKRSSHSGKSLAVSPEDKRRVTTRLSRSSPRYLPGRKETICPRRNSNKNVPSREMDTVQMPVHRCLDKRSLGRPRNGISLGHKKEQSTQHATTWKSLDTVPQRGAGPAPRSHTGDFLYAICLKQANPYRWGGECQGPGRGESGKSLPHECTVFLRYHEKCCN